MLMCDPPHPSAEPCSLDLLTTCSFVRAKGRRHCLVQPLPLQGLAHESREGRKTRSGVFLCLSGPSREARACCRARNLAFDLGHL